MSETKCPKGEQIMKEKRDKNERNGKLKEKEKHVNIFFEKKRPFSSTAFSAKQFGN